MLDFDLNGQIIEILKYDINNHIFNDIIIFRFKLR